MHMDLQILLKQTAILKPSIINKNQKIYIIQAISLCQDPRVPLWLFLENCRKANFTNIRLIDMEASFRWILKTSMQDANP